jgi:CYTH domain-containing protein
MTGAAPPKYALPEIERRWLVSDAGAIDLAHCPVRRIDDRYIAGTHLRLRRISGEGTAPIFKLGKKYLPKDGVMQLIVNAYLSEAEFAVFAALPALVSCKRRFSVAGGSLDVYESPRAGFMLFEREFANRVEALAYTPPPFAGTEITDAPDYSGFRLAQAVADPPSGMK